MPDLIIADLSPMPQWMYTTLLKFLPFPYKYSPKTAVLAPLSIKQGRLSFSSSIAFIGTLTQLSLKKRLGFNIIPSPLFNGPTAPIPMPKTSFVYIQIQ